MHNRYYPADALPLIIRDAVYEVEGIVKAPIALVAASALSNISLACQSRISVRRFNGIESPCGLYVLYVAESGERKSTLDKYFGQPFRDFEMAQDEAIKPLMKAYRAEKLAWDAESKGILSAIKASAKNDQDCAELKNRLAIVLDRKPVEPQRPKFIYSDVTPEALAEGLQKWASAGIFSGEAGALFDGRTFGNLGMLNLLWDGGAWTVDRRNSEPISVKGANLSISLMVQPKTLNKFLEGKGSFARDNGFLARFLLGWPISTQGLRPEKFLSPPPTPSLDILNQRIFQILLGSVGHDGQLCKEKTNLEFSEDGKRECVDFTNRVEAALCENGYFCDIRDAAAKIADNMARMAALFHFVEAREGLITVETVTQAIKICTWHIEQFKNIFGRKPEIPIEVLDANELEKWLFNFYQRYPWGSEIRKNVIAQLGPNKLRACKLRREAALYILSTNNKVRVERRGKTQWVVLNPDFFPIASNSRPSYSTQNLSHYRCAV